ncbi:thiamine diphosphokinase [Rickettsiales endosymbiont of Stachyamoeba lipophora]|uniref:thiamine diphosphokinase n=1 Tax=Rickettsiales endosymbiont of Stachyamoeba lipophora TaxID=2486578 RepID=UPI000F6560C0|nr:thiamine diphosphokinase [Rickettsiales endosymbiont of Stachyamoeba lipophora]AZL16405.1 thiamine diphosphokinase [Rickettsiales endosymbiont of Stachyamoeba lipophora]
MQQAIIICNGEAPSFPFNVTDKIIIAADGGANICSSFNINPHYIIGDLDSFENHNFSKNTQIIKINCQESNDFEKALKLCEELGITFITVYAATGKRIDQTLTNLCLLQKYSHLNIQIIDHYFISCVLIPNRDYEFSGWQGRIVSLFPLSGKAEAITTLGLKYTLNNESLENGFRHGSSNEMLLDTFRISFKGGYLILMMERTVNLL